MQQPEFTTLSLTLADQIAEVRLNRPDKSNAINEAMWQEIRQAFEWIDATPEARVVILSGAGATAPRAPPTLSSRSPAAASHRWPLTHRGRSQ